ncbi:MAG: guanylate kinase [Deltaproteobacteria bacterium]|nr:guanylate kinase [Deltaproteobacteria bacterium]
MEDGVGLQTTAWSAPEQGALFVVTGPSGTGKTTLVQEALKSIPGLKFSVSATTRPQRRGEQDGRDYHFLDRDAFTAKIEAGEFLEWAEVYGNFYGTLKGPVNHALENGSSILLDIDTQGAEQVRATAHTAISIFVLPPDMNILAHRLKSRATDEPAVIERRIQEAKHQLREACHFDYLVVNDDLRSAHDQFQAIVVAELLRTSRHKQLTQRFAD